MNKTIKKAYREQMRIAGHQPGAVEGHEGGCTRCDVTAKFAGGNYGIPYYIEYYRTHHEAQLIGSRPERLPIPCINGGATVSKVK